MTLVLDSSSSTSNTGNRIEAAIAAAAARRDAEAQIAQIGERDVPTSERALMMVSFRYFLSKLKDDKGEPLKVRWHNQQWADLMQDERLLCLMAARGHWKTWTAYAYICWRMWKHNRNADGVIDPTFPEGNFEAMYFTSVIELAKERFERIKQFMLDSIDLFWELLPARLPGQPMAVIADVWTRTKIALRNHATLQPKSIGSSVRGPHPQLIVADDIVTDKNGRTPLQRGRVWAYIISTLRPMVGDHGQMIVMGTPQHYEDALHKLYGKPGWRWIKYRAVNWDTEQVLCEDAYSLQGLKDEQTTDPILFSREFQMDPRDDATSIFPYALTGRVLEPALKFVRPFRRTQRPPGEFIVGGMDLAISEAAGADYTVLWMALYNRFTAHRTLLWATRARGLTFDEQVDLLKDVCRDFTPDIIVVEQNTFQKWLHQHVTKYPETAHRIFGHTTGIEKQSLTEGIPSLKVILSANPPIWTMPVGDEESAAFVAEWRSEMNAFGYAEGKLGTVAEHDDTVMSYWLTERAIRLIEEWMPSGTGDVATAEDVGIERVSIGSAY